MDIDFWRGAITWEKEREVVVGGESKVLGVEAGVMDFGEKGEVEVKHYK